VDAPIAIYFLTALVLGLLGLTQWILRRICAVDPSLFESLGRPDIFTGNNVHTMSVFWRWVCGASLRYRGDPGLVRALWVLRLATVAYVLCLVLFVASQL
jgi:hypothetical protein